jgi:hypothetical protein
MSSIKISSKQDLLILVSNLFSEVEATGLVPSLDNAVLELRGRTLRCGNIVITRNELEDAFENGDQIWRWLKGI